MNLNELYKKNLNQTKQKIKESVLRDILIIQAYNMIEDINKSSNILVNRIRDWFEFYCPEFSKSIKSHPRFIELITTKSKKELLKEINIKESDSMGADLKKEDLNILVKSAKSLDNLYKQKQEIEKYLKSSMQDVCPNLMAVAGINIGAKLLSFAGSLKKLSEFPSSTIQLLGAEKALFRHISGKGKSPKHGVLINHPLMQGHSAKDKGRIARVLADKISIAVKVDYFKGKFVGDKLRADLDKRFKK